MPPYSPLEQIIATYQPVTRGSSAAERAPLRPWLLAQLGGTWKGTLAQAKGDRGTAFVLTQRATTEGYHATLSFPQSDGSSTDVHLLEASETTFVALAGPHSDSFGGAPVFTLIEARRDGNRLSGSFSSRRVGSPREPKRRFVAFRAEE